MVRRLFASPLPAVKTELALDDESRHHAQVLRLSVGDELRLFDAQGREADATVVRCDRRALVCVVEPACEQPAPREQLHLGLCVPKPAKLELIVRMLTELGVRSLQLVQSERSVPKWGGEGGKLERYRRIAIEACAQSEQAYAPVLSAPVPLSAALAGEPCLRSAYRCAFVERSAAMQLPRDWTGAVREVWAIVGPEGGFAPAEQQLMAEQGVQAITLGRAILRVETASVVACALLLDRLRAQA
jgi:16S rRNA (uracil1498-N3)-methyltransferase